MPRVRDVIPIWRLERTLALWKAARNRKADSVFFERLIRKTDDFGRVTWLGKPIWQNILDLWTIQETLFTVSPALLIECGTNRGGSAYFFASLFEGTVNVKRANGDAAVVPAGRTPLSRTPFFSASEKAEKAAPACSALALTTSARF